LYNTAAGYIIIWKNGGGDNNCINAGSVLTKCQRKKKEGERESERERERERERKRERERERRGRRKMTAGTPAAEMGPLAKVVLGTKGDMYWSIGRAI
jgi:hypothetical protein